MPQFHTCLWLKSLITQILERRRYYLRVIRCTSQVEPISNNYLGYVMVAISAAKFYPFPPVTSQRQCYVINVYIFTSRVCGRGNVFVVSVCVSVCVCLCVCVCLSVQAITFEPVDIETSFLVWCYILTISRSSLSIKVMGSRSCHGKC